MIAQAKCSFYVLAAVLVIGEASWDQLNYFYTKSGLPGLTQIIADKDLAFHFKQLWPNCKVYVDSQSD